MHTTLTTRSLAAAGAAALSAALLLSGCSSSTKAGSGAPVSATTGASASASASASPSGATGGGGTSGAPSGSASGAVAGAVVVHNADKGRTVTLHPGQTLEVVLTGGYWAAPTSSPASVLKLSGAPTLASPSPGEGCPPGVGCRAQQTEFVAVAAGTATVSSSRSNCGEAMRCTDANGKFSITVTVATS